MRKNIKISKSATVSKGAKIGTNVQILGKSIVASGCVIGSGSVLVDAVLNEGCTVENSRIEKSEFGKLCKIGPYANVRAGCKVADNVKVGAFVELKNATIGSGCKMAHLSYIGDAKLGKNVNIGCGVVFANYDGKEKHFSTVGDNVFVGCNVNIVAPVEIADDTYICAGTTVTKNTEKGDFVIGRVRQENKKRD